MTHAVHEHTAHTPGPAPGRREWLALALICLAQFMLIADITVVNVALPTIGHDLGLAHGDVTWVVAAYSTAFGGLMILGGRLADAIGRRRMFLVGLTIFTVASIVSGTADSGGMLIAGRAAQGIGAALLSPAALSIVTTAFTGAARTRALALWATIGGAGAAIGVLLGGVLTSYASWRWVFFVNVPIGVVVAACIPALIAAARPDRSTPLDVRGAVTITISAAAMVFGLVRAGDVGWSSTSAIVALAVGVLGTGVFIAIERTSAVPLMPLSMLRRRPMVTGVAMMLAASGLLLAAFFLNSLYVQQVRQLSPVRTGLLFLPVAIAIGAGVHVGTRLARTAGPRIAGSVGLGLAAVGAGLLTRVGAHSSVLTVVLPGFVVLGIGLGAVLIAATTTALAGAGHAEAGVLSGIVNSGHELGGAFGVAVISAVAGASVTGPAIVAGGWPVSGFSRAFAVCAVFAAVAAVVTFLAVRPGRVEMAEGAVPMH